MCNPLHCFHVPLVSLNLQFAESCSKVRDCRWTRLEDGIGVWLSSTVVAGVKTWTQTTHTASQTTIKGECGSKPVLLMKGPGSKWRDALLLSLQPLMVRVGQPSLPALTVLEGVYGLAMGWEITELGAWQSVCLSALLGGLAAAPSVPAAVYLVRSNVCSPARPLILKTREWLLRITYFCLETSQGRE